MRYDVEKEEYVKELSDYLVYLIGYPVAGFFFLINILALIWWLR